MEVETEPNLGDLPENVIVNMLSFLKYNEIATAARINHKWNDTSKDPKLWDQFSHSFSGVRENDS